MIGLLYLQLYHAQHALHRNQATKTQSQIPISKEHPVFSALGEEKRFVNIPLAGAEVTQWVQRHGDFIKSVPMQMSPLLWVLLISFGATGGSSYVENGLNRNHGELEYSVSLLLIGGHWRRANGSNNFYFSNSLIECVSVVSCRSGASTIRGYDGRGA